MRKRDITKRERDSTERGKREGEGGDRHTENRWKEGEKERDTMRNRERGGETEKVKQLRWKKQRQSRWEINGA